MPTARARLRAQAAPGTAIIVTPRTHSALTEECGAALATWLAALTDETRCLVVAADDAAPDGVAMWVPDGWRGSAADRRYIGRDRAAAAGRRADTRRGRRAGWSLRSS